MLEQDRRYRIDCAKQLFARDPGRAVEELSKFLSASDLEEALDYSEAGLRSYGSSPTAGSELASPDRSPVVEPGRLRPRGPSDSSYSTSRRPERGFASARGPPEASSVASSASQASRINNLYEFPRSAKIGDVEYLSGKGIRHELSFITGSAVARCLTPTRDACACRATGLRVACADVPGGYLSSVEHISLTYLLPTGPSDKRLFHIVDWLPDADVFFGDSPVQSNRYCYATTAEASNSNPQPVQFGSFHEVTTDLSSQNYPKSASSKGTLDRTGSTKVDSSAGASAKSGSSQTSVSRVGSSKGSTPRHATLSAKGSHSRGSQSSSKDTVVRGSQMEVHTRPKHAPSRGSALPVRTAASIGSARSSVKAASDAGRPEVASRVGSWVRDVPSEDVSVSDPESVRTLYIFGKSTKKTKLSLRAPHTAFMDSLMSKLGRICTQPVIPEVHLAHIRQEFEDGEVFEFDQALDDASLAEDWADWTAELLEEIQHKPLKQLVFEIQEPG